ncbi:hypothetical protein G6F46_004210 [Rhizopus delemar]|uniref:Uncharacterized protein n=2 Tax=Rhizopus TaxID=4842 RepID=A0A9P6Z990_9FUNG|nr:hypothetical protein G6F55_008620 [Rhizopus delemar]KAG1548087.1 hypothetical protein G6F51_003870 [Rhizopus arrhizus]KAG1500748.1 hypothetical protein G6F54_003505 [Rhizopus delemar]KAG1514315.1 hypothetical protein G6F53_003763 [Rhizopus delemar]KAG1522007.1 hypothetical protein G6F52_006232 [Rhizopus delemar]
MNNENIKFASTKTWQDDEEHENLILTRDMDHTLSIHDPSDSEDEWVDIVSNEKETSIETRTVFDGELQEPDWGYEEDQERVDTIIHVISHNLTRRPIEASWPQKFHKRNQMNNHNNKLFICQN